MMAEEVIPPLLSVEEANAPDEPDSGCVEIGGADGNLPNSRQIRKSS